LIAVIDYGMGNLRSVTNALEKLGADVVVTKNKEVIKASKAIILPGVGAFGKCIENLEKLELLGFLKETIKDGKQYLGICLGMQVLFESSEEAPGIAGMGVLKGTVPRFTGQIKIPHMGWNNINIVKETGILQGIENGEHFYFVHSYYCSPEEKGIVATTTPYGGEFVSSVQKDNIFACQFHPEKSQQVGLKLLHNFINLSKQA
jgi:imidazole glycerol-phosphate synthase subunit HisH